MEERSAILSLLGYNPRWPNRPSKIPAELRSGYRDLVRNLFSVIDSAAGADAPAYYRPGERGYETVRARALQF
ncbi:MAG: hypothetical protein KDN22_31740 [Verrucomicrobiae bacterium]|nr:hypothetical protein [Verrucomicrobiae bacterium]